MADGERTKFADEPTLLITVCAKHGMLRINPGCWIEVPKLVAFLTSSQRDENIHVYAGQCDKCEPTHHCCGDNGCDCHNE